MIALVPLITEVENFIAWDVPELGAFSSEIQTYIISVALFCVTTFSYRNSDKGAWYMLYSAPFYSMVFSFVSAAVLNKFV